MSDKPAPLTILEPVHSANNVVVFFHLKNSYLIRIDLMFDWVNNLVNLNQMKYLMVTEDPVIVVAREQIRVETMSEELRF